MLSTLNRALIGGTVGVLFILGAATVAHAGPTVWQPAENTPWQWEIGTPLNTSKAALMGTGVTAYNGDTAPADNPKLIDIDAFDNPASTVTTLHADGIKAVCYIEVGTAGNYYTAAEEGQTTTFYSQLAADGDLGKKLSGYPEKFININAPSSVGVVEEMIDQCATKGFDGVETDLDETFGNNEGATGFSISQAQEESYLETLANYMHSKNLAWFAKNLSDTGSQSFVSDLEPFAQGLIDEQSFQYKTYPLDAVFTNAGKWVGAAEYGLSQSAFCTKANSLDENGVKFNVNLNTQRKPCR